MLASSTDGWHAVRRAAVYMRKRRTTIHRPSATIPSTPFPHQTLTQPSRRSPQARGYTGMLLITPRGTRDATAGKHHNTASGGTDCEAVEAGRLHTPGGPLAGAVRK